MTRNRKLNISQRAILVYSKAKTRGIALLDIDFIFSDYIDII